MTEKPESSKHPTQRVRKTEEDPDAPSAAAEAASLNLLKMGRPVSELRLGIHGLTTAELEQRVREVLHSLEIIPNDSRMQDFRVVHEFPEIGRKTMLLNACRIDQEDQPPQLILLAIKEASENE
jgi:hypothetical protein